MSQAAVETFEELRPLLFSIAYRMLGSAAEAEDIVQESFVRYHHALDGGTDIASPKAYLSAAATRLAIDQLRSARRRREQYVGTWLPEPLLTAAGTEPDVAARVETDESLSFAFLVVLESLSPVERAVFLLHDVFDFGYDEIAEIVERSEDNCRQIAVRARRRVEERKPRFETSRRKRDELARRFLAAIELGDTDGLVGMLAHDVVLYGDGGGKAPAISRPVEGATQVATVLVGWSKIAVRTGMRLEFVEVNGQPGLQGFDAEGRLLSVAAFDIADGVVWAVRSVVNPEKLAHLGPVGDAWAAFHAPRD
jgi:RNA polymerase sigma-70 factor (ECF subfamily)